ncbi:feruloyl esterase [Sphingobium sp. B1D7B]|uniref:tannase/feruloyl esterase family alpha/beta hydrolase n=1 Tax=unclassified Sphingobium TaxID=2611147 RepID=UPI0022257D1F|nr:MULTISPECIES: tannase/feruloyl esterase family alpha/beta hydrolase [unclassified Sphingobium]MCW2392860.1 feruloyl esterase [Sphingobium sp. B11D3A]MCW2404662.1 feruloyl esterase [Sphingobium sp. B1D7B]
MTMHRLMFAPLAAILALLPHQLRATEAPPSGTTSAMPAATIADATARCAALGARMAGHWPDASTRLLSATFNPAGPAPVPPGPPGMTPPPVELPAHCAIVGATRTHTGVDGQAYAIRFHLRLPVAWNGRFFFSGGGGTNGELGDAIGRLTAAAPALAQGYAVLSQDSGHDNATNSDPARGGASAFGFDPQARADYGGTSLPVVTHAAKAAIRQFYGSDPRQSYFVGCSKGGQEGMMLAQRYPDLFDGIVAAAPGFSLPKAAIAEAWNTQAFASVVQASGKPVTLANLRASFSMGDLALVGQAVRTACDALDGMTDGLIGAVGQCTSARVLPQLRASLCKGDKAEGCLSQPQLDALVRIHEGARDSKGAQIYPGFPWDAGWADMGWRIWMLGTPDGSVPPINVAMGLPSLAAVFMTPPTLAGATPDELLAWAMRLDMDRARAGVEAVVPPFTRSAWQDIGARSSDLDAFRARGGKLIVPHGMSDPVFSVNDTLAWWGEVDARYKGAARDFVRVFPVPGMGHCAGGPATDQYDAFGALVAWVEQGKRPDQLSATAGPMSGLNGIQRPICAAPAIARRTGDTSDQSAAQISCTQP